MSCSVEAHDEIASDDTATSPGDLNGSGDEARDSVETRPCYGP